MRHQGRDRRGRARSQVDDLVGHLHDCHVHSDHHHYRADHHHCADHTTAAPPPDIRSVDLAAVTYRLSCPIASGEVEIVPKDGPTSTPGGDVEIDGGLEPVYGDVTGDGRDDAVVKVACIPSDGGNAFVANVALVVSDRGGARQVGPAVEGFDPAIEGSVVAVARAVYADDDARCCPSTIRYLPLTFAGDHLAEGGTGGQGATTSDVATTTGIGGFQVGRSYSQIAATLGRPVVTNDDLQTEGECLSVSIEGGPDIFGLGDAKHLGSVEVSTDAIRTKSGLGIGSTEAEVYRAFGDRVRSDPHTYLVPDGHYLTFVPEDDPAHVVVFDTDGTTVTHFRVGEDGWAHAFEGCA